MKNIKIGSMLAGIGEIWLAFKQACFEVVWANERDKKACNTYRKNYGSKYLQECDIARVNPDVIPDFDILVVGFPCQFFSIAGSQRGFQDPRGNMFFEIARITDEKKPSIIFLENAANLQKHDKGNTFLVIYNTLATLGYTVRSRILSVNEYGNLPQARSKIFIIAFKNNMCPTLTANMGTHPDRVPIICDDYGIRKLTLRACLDFQGFMKEFKFSNNITIDDAYKQIGNSVTVPVIQSLALEIRGIVGGDLN